MNLKYLCTCRGILKIITVALGFICFVVGCFAYFSQSEKSEIKSIVVECTNGDCSSGVKAFEPWYLVIVGLAFVVSFVGLILSLCCKLKGCLKVLDVIYHMTAGVCLIISGSVLIASAIKIDEDTSESLKQALPSSLQDRPVLEDFRKLQMFGEKLAAGALTILNGIFYLIVGCCVCTTDASDDEW